MRKFNLMVDVATATGTGESLSVAATVVLPPEQFWAGPVPVLFGFPGGGYSRHYFDLQLGDGPNDGYSQAEHHARGGFVFVACDHLGVGDSDVPTKSLDYQAVARADAECARKVAAMLELGELHPDVRALSLGPLVGVGQSFGGYLLTLAQAADPVFDAVAFLGWSGIETVVPWSQGTQLDDVLRRGTGTGYDNPRRPTFFRDDVPRDIVVRDLTRTSDRAGSPEAWGAAYYPGGPRLTSDESPMMRGVVAAQAATIEVPVLVAVGDVDVVADLAAEASAYPMSPDLTLCRFPGMGHMHNFAGTRGQLWRRLHGWIGAAVMVGRSE
jgi:pimeloyl-ACP methyl ester carboxylesterase